MRKFTLVELLIVIGIIAILLTLLLPSLSRSREMARRSVCLSNLSQMNRALMLYSKSYDEYVPRDAYSNASDGETFTFYLILPFLGIEKKVVEKSLEGFEILFKELKGEQLFTCPSFESNLDLTYTVNARSWEVGVNSDKESYHTNEGFDHLYKLDFPQRVASFTEVNSEVVDSLGNTNIWKRADLPYSQNGASQFDNTRMMNLASTEHMGTVNISYYDCTSKIINLKSKSEFQLGLLDGKTYE